MKPARADDVDVGGAIAFGERRPSRNLDGVIPHHPLDRCDGRSSRALDARDSLGRLAQALEERRAVLDLELQPLGVHTGDQNRSPINTEIQAGERGEGADEEPRRDNQHERQRDLRDDVEVARARIARRRRCFCLEP